MQEIMIEGKPELVYMLKDGEFASIVIPVSGLDIIDDRRLREVEDKDGEMLYNMSRTKADNGMNLLDLYSTYIKTVKKARPQAKAESEPKSEITQESAQTSGKRSPGRPRGARSKSASKAKVETETKAETNPDKTK